MAEINEITVFKDGDGNPSYGLVDDQNRVVVSLGVGGTGKYIQGFSGDITSGTDNPVVSYTVPTGKIFHLTKWESDGHAHATFKVLEGANIIAQQRNSVAQPTVGGPIGDGIDFPAGTVLKITVDHHETGKTSNFSGTLYGEERNA